MSKAIQNADLDWQCIDGIEIPVSKKFGDIYFSKDNGLLEARHVFLNGNDLCSRLQNLNDYEYFCVGETGFGTGLNILALWQLWQYVRPNNHSHLHVISVEQFPLAKEDFIRAVKAWPELKSFADQFISQYPQPIAGCHRLKFPNSRFSIDLWLGDAQDILPIMQKTKPVNAWFLDGFAPSCNPEIWNEKVVDNIVRLSERGTTFSSFSVAGILKNSLKNRGMTISKPSGFGQKNEMLKAIWTASEIPPLQNLNLKPDTTQITAPITHHTASKIAERLLIQYPIKAPIFKQRQIAIIGAGIAGLSCAWAFAQRGHQVTIYDQSAPLTGASGNPLALINPKLSAIEQSLDHLMTVAWLYAMNYYQNFDAFRPIAIHQLALKNPEEVFEIAPQYPNNILKAQTAEQLNLVTEFASLQLTQAGSISPHQLCEQILQHPLIQFKTANVCAIEKQFNHTLSLKNEYANSLGEFDHVITCCAFNCKNFFESYPLLKPNRGQVSWVNNQAHPLNQDQAYSYAGYCMQLNSQELLLGASFYPHRDDDQVLQEDHVHNYNLIHSTFPAYAESLPPIKEWKGRASVRVQSPDYFPLVGKMQEQSEIYTLSALGSKGFLYAPLCSEVLASLVLGEACPVSAEVLQRINTRRFQKRVKPKKPYYQANTSNSIL